MAVFEGTVLEEARSIMTRYPAGRQRSAVMPLLYLAQSVEGRVTADGLREVADLLDIRTAEVEAVASFYTMIRLRETGTHVISVCTNLACALLGAKDVLEAANRACGTAPGADASPDGMFTVHEEECLGCCEHAPVVQVNFANHDRVTADRVTQIVEQVRAGEIPEPSRGPAVASFRDASRILAGLRPKPQPQPEPEPEPQPSAEVGA
jgi:NADH-quinone oxidoreductase subunit E